MLRPTTGVMNLGSKGLASKAAEAEAVLVALGDGVDAGSAAISAQEVAAKHCKFGASRAAWLPQKKSSDAPQRITEEFKVDGEGPEFCSSRSHCIQRVSDVTKTMLGNRSFAISKLQKRSKEN